MSDNELVPYDIPKPPRRRKGGTKETQKERKKQGIEAAAIAYVQMENGEYRYAPSVPRNFNPDGSPSPNKREVMRRAGYAPGSADHFDEYLGNNERFWELVELHRLRRTDPMFRKENEDSLWSEVGNEALRNLYERVFYYPHELTVEQHVRIVKLILDAGITLQKMGKKSDSKADKLLSSIDDPEKRNKILGGYKKKLEEELKNLESLEKAHNAADEE